MGRTLIAVIVGVLVGGLLVAGVELIGHSVYPVPEDLDLQDREAMAEYVKQAPKGALLFVLMAWGVGSLGGGWVATRIARGKLVPALVVGGLLLAGGLFSLVTIPHPLWFTVIGVLLFLPAAWMGARLAGAGVESSSAP